MTAPSWISRRRWSVAHALRPDSTEQFLGAEYTRTLCGLRVRSDELVSRAEGVPLCANCAAKAGAS
jgi:hypothetical protein